LLQETSAAGIVVAVFLLALTATVAGLRR